MLDEALKGYDCEKKSSGDFIEYECGIGLEPWNVFGDKDDNVVYIEAPDYYEEIMVPEVLAQHGSWPSKEEIVEYLRDKLGALKTKEIEKKGPEALDEAFANVLEEEFNKRVQEITSKPARTIKLSKKTKLIISPDVIEKKCFVNIPHHHYYEGKVCKIIDPENVEVLKKGIDICLTDPP